MKSNDSHKPWWWDASNTRAMLIGRISDRKQKDGVSLEAQQHELERYAESNGLAATEVRSFQESAKKSELRSEFHAAIARAKALNIRHLIFYMYDRIARNFTDAELLEEMIRDGEFVLHVTSSRQVLSKDSPDSDFFNFDINMAQAKQDNRNRRTKTIDGMAARARLGWCPGRVPYPYAHQPIVDEAGRVKKRGSIIVGPTDEGRRWLRREMELHLAGYSLDRIRETCLREGIVPASWRARYHRSVIEKRLKNPFFAALAEPHDDFKSQYEWRGTLYDGKHEPIYSAHEWARLQASFGRKAVYRKVKHEGLFSQGSLALACGECGCKITYAPKTKKCGRRYDYYRCADGKRVHKSGGQPQVNVLEGDILDQLGTAVDLIAVTEDMAEAIAHAMSETHRQAQAAKAKEAEGYRAQVKTLDERENRLYDRLDAGEIDSDTYKAQRERLRGERDALFEKLRDTDREIDTAYLTTTRRVLELAKHAKRLWNQRSPEERRDFLAKLLWNPTLHGRTVRFDLQKPFEVLAKMSRDQVWRPYLDDFRTAIIEYGMAA